MLNNNPIGVFDSGIGGLTVVKCIRDRLPHENIVYFGDIARLPYGTKSVATIRNFARQTVKFLLNQNVKTIVIACNTISAVASDEVKKLAGNIPVINVISAGSKACAFISNKQQIGVIATPATINSQAYNRAISALNPNIEVLGIACSLFVPLIEENFIQHKALQLIAQEYLTPLIDAKIDTLVLGCTHYPLIREIIAQIMGGGVQLIDPAFSTATELIQILKAKSLLNNSAVLGQQSFFVTELAPKFQTIGEAFLQTKISNPKLVNIEKI